jgi:hypothetical protein
MFVASAIIELLLHLVSCLLLVGSPKTENPKSAEALLTMGANS